MVTMEMMMIKCSIMRKSDTSYEWTLLIFLIFLLNVDSFQLKCPSQANWKFRAKVKCNSTMKYFCLYNNVDRKYVEGCNGPDWDRKGSKRIFAGYFTREKCKPERFQPIKFWTNESMSDCIYAKSLCSEEGQIVEHDSTKDDRTCRCDYKNSYSYIKTPRNLCTCIPIQEDCSCYIKTCPGNFTLSQDYVCIPSGYQGNSACKDMMYSKTIVEKTRDIMENNDTFISERSLKFNKWTEARAAMLFVCFCFIVVTSGFTIALQMKPFIQRTDTDTEIEEINKMCTVNESNDESFRNSSGDKKQDLKEINGVQIQTESIDIVEGMNLKVCEDNDILKKMTELVDVTVQPQIEISEQRRHEVNYLRIIHLLFRIACPVVRMIFDHEIQPKQLRRTLDKKRFNLEKQYRKNETSINDYQWNILFGTKGKPVTSTDFDIRLMTYLLSLIAKIEIGDLYPVQLDTSISAMLTKIKYIRNDASQNIDGKLEESQFKQYWDDLGQAILILVSPYIQQNNKDKEKKLLIDRLYKLNPINIDNDKLCTFILKSEIYPLMILRTFISEYCELNKTTVKKVLVTEKHQLYHKRHKTEKCCLCRDNQFSTYIKVLPEKHWSALYDIIDGTSLHSCPFKLNICNEKIMPKRTFDIDTCDVSVAVSLILYIPNILKCFVSRLCINGFDKFLTNNQHTLYHSVNPKRCCKCVKDPTEKPAVSYDEWNKMFLKEDNIVCTTGNEKCCCLYSVRNEIKHVDIDDMLLSKVFYSAGPFSLINKIGQDAFTYFLIWNVDDHPIQSMLTELHKVLDKKSSFNPSQLDKSKVRMVDVEEWMSKHLRELKSGIEPLLPILVSEKGCLKMMGIQIPNDLIASDRVRQFEDITPEEHNFLVVVHALKAIVHPVMKIQLKKICPHELDKILMQIYYGRCNKGLNENTKRCRSQNIYLSGRRREQLFSPTKDDSSMSKNLDLKVMLYVLTHRPEDSDTALSQREWKKRLDDINKIRREIMQSSSGVLEETRFQDIMKCISETVLQLGGDKLMEELSHLQNNKNILECN